LLLFCAVILLGVFKFAYDGFRSLDQRSGEARQIPAGGVPPARFAKAELAVQGLSCSSCIQEIETALAGIEGVEEVLVDIPRGKAQVYFDPDRIDTSKIIAEEISNAGYPASVVKVLDAEEVAAGNEVFAGINGENLEDNLKVQCLNRLISEAVMLQEVSRAGHVLAKNVDQEFTIYLRENDQDLETFKAGLKEFGYPFEYYKKKFENQIRIQEYLENTIMKSATTRFQQQALYDQWFRNAQSLAEITYYDKELERLVQNAAAGSSCCP
jgi:copper chaperone CopZ